MVVFNFTGLSRVYWRPCVRRQAHEDLWYVTVRFLGVEVVFYSRAMGSEFIKRFNKGLYASTPEVRQVPDPA